MQRILVAFDSLKLDISALEFACYLGQISNSKLTGVFLDNLVADQKLVLRPAYGSSYPDWEIKEDSPRHREKMMKIKSNIAVFKEICEKKAVRYDVHRDPGVPKLEICYETRFADLLVVSAGISFNKTDEESPTRFIREILKDAECPVVIAPEKFQGLDEIIFTYDGSRSAAFAIRQFAYLFPILDIKVTVVQVNKSGDWPVEEKNNIRDWLGFHYSSVGFQTLKGDTEHELLLFLLKRKNIFVVMGAFGRNNISMFFKHSKAELILQSITQPFFIAHH